MPTGTYARTAALDRLISSFLRGGGGEGGGGKRQIVSLGAGTDTRVFRLFGPQAQPPQTDLIYHEIDFPAVAAKKLQLVRAVPPLRNIVPDPASVPITTTTSEDPNDENGTRTATNSTTCWSSGGGSGELPNGCEYWCHGRDLRDLVRPGAPPLRGLRRDVPTLLVSECCLCYLEAAQSRAVIEYFAGSGEGAGTAGIADLAVVLYEPIRPDDAFGRQMVANLAARRIRMPSLDAYGTAAAQTARLRAAGFEGGAEARTVEDVWREWVPDGEKERVDGLEGLDEVEEWNLLAAHYVVAWGWRGRGFEGWEGGGGGAG
ncbi:carboxy methyl transferase for protein phosphatase 2A [Diatrype stigma]|uniref:Leucine carboxyl methyltransferase 1 n=1 Tax=Diatrype stigma TaxID=117547 RepID=A0AAN9V8S3_9PEZI